MSATTGLGGKIHLGINVYSPDAICIQKLYPGHWDAHLDRGHDSIDGLGDGIERTNRSTRCLRLPLQAQCQFGDDAQRAL